MPAIKRFPWRNPLWAALNLLPIALAAITAKVFGSATIALFRTTFTAPPTERYADLGLALIALCTVLITALIATIFCNLMLVPGWKHSGDTIDIHPDRMVVVENGTTREIPWEQIPSDPIVESNRESSQKRFVPERILTIMVQDQDPVRIPDGHLQFREIAAAITQARAAFADKHSTPES